MGRKTQAASEAVDKLLAASLKSKPLIYDDTEIRTLDHPRSTIGCGSADDTAP